MNDIRKFEVREDGGFLAGYLQNRALQDEESGIARTYIVRSKASDELIGYFSLKAGFVSVNTRWRSFDSVPGVEIANFAVNDAYIQKHPELKGIGKAIFVSFIKPTVMYAAEYLGIKILYIFALPREQLMKRYREYNFSRLNAVQERGVHKRIRPRYDRGCIFMYQML